MSVFEGLTITYENGRREGMILQSQIIYTDNLARLVFIVTTEYDWLNIVYYSMGVKFKKEDLERLKRKSLKFEKTINRFELMEMEE